MIRVLGTSEAANLGQGRSVGTNDPEMNSQSEDWITSTGAGEDNTGSVTAWCIRHGMTWSAVGTRIQDLDDELWRVEIEDSFGCHSKWRQSGPHFSENKLEQKKLTGLAVAKELERKEEERENIQTEK